MSDELAKKQDTLESGTTLKTLNGKSLLGSGDITVEAGDVSYSNAGMEATNVQAAIDEQHSQVDDLASKMVDKEDVKQAESDDTATAISIEVGSLTADKHITYSQTIESVELTTIASNKNELVLCFTAAADCSLNVPTGTPVFGEIAEGNNTLCVVDGKVLIGNFEITE